MTGGQTCAVRSVEREATGTRACSSSSTMSLHFAIRRSVVSRMSATAAAALRWRALKALSAGSFHSGSTSVARCSVSFSAVYTACRTALLVGPEP